MGLAAPAQACYGALERSFVIVKDRLYKGLMLPGGSRLIYRNGFVKGCRASDGFCLSEIVLSRDASLCGLKVPKETTVYLNYSRRTFDHHRTVDSPEEGPGVFLTLVGAPVQQVAGLEVKDFIEVRCDKRVAQAKDSPLRGATLNQPMEIYGISLPAGSGLVWYSPNEGGQVASLRIESPMTVRDLSLPARSMLDFDPSGVLTQIRSHDYSSATVGPYRCWTGFSQGPTLHPNGALASFLLLGSHAFKGFVGREETLFYQDGTLRSSTLAEDATISGQKGRAGQVVRFRPDGSLVSISRRFH